MLERIQHLPFKVPVARDHEWWLGQESRHNPVACDGRRHFAPLPSPQVMFGSLDVANEFENRHGVRAKLLRKLILDWLGVSHESRLVDILDNLDAHCLQ